MSRKQDLLKRIEALEISGELIDDELKRIEDLKKLRKFIDDEIAKAKASLEQLEAKQEAIWKENQYVKDPATRPLAEYCRSLGYFIVGCQTKEPKSEFYAIAKTILKYQEDAVPFLKELYKRHGDKEFSYSIAELPASRKTDFLNICTEMQKNKWISFKKNKSKSELLVISSIPKKDKSFLNGGWAEEANRYLVNKVLTDYSANHEIKYKVFWDVKLKLLESENNNLNDMQLDLVAKINDRFYVFETKSGVLGIDKWVKRAGIFNQNGNRFITCCMDPKANYKYFMPYRLMALEKIEKLFPELLDRDFPQTEA